MRFGRRLSGIRTKWPAELILSEHCEDNEHTCLLEDFSVWDFVEPLRPEQFAEAGEVKSVEFVGVPLVYWSRSHLHIVVW